MSAVRNQRLRRLDVSVVLVALLLAETRAADLPDTSHGKVTVEDSEIAAVTERWNTAVEQGRRGDWGAALHVLRPEDRSGWFTEDSSTNLLRLHLGNEIRPENEKVIVYRGPDGTWLARIYGERRHDLRLAGKTVPLCSRILLGTMMRRANEPWFLEFSSRDDRPFGLGASVEGIRFTAHPTQHVLESWKDLRLTVAFTNTDDARSIAVRPSPTAYLGWNLAIGLIEADSSSEEELFKVWYEKLEEMSVLPISGLLERARTPPKPVTLQPGRRHVFVLDLATLCWKGGRIPEGPSGSFQLFLTYDANLEWDEVGAALPTWSHRVASNVFRVTVTNGD